MLPGVCESRRESAKTRFSRVKENEADAQFNLTVFCLLFSSFFFLSLPSHIPSSHLVVPLPARRLALFVFLSPSPSPDPCDYLSPFYLFSLTIDTLSFYYHLYKYIYNNIHPFAHKFTSNEITIYVVRGSA